ncbi:MAG: hypothetical protein AB1489_15755 [Acidobacteriota bacterium]
MNLIQLSSRRSKPEPVERILGRWQLVRSDAGLEANESVTMEFTREGKLIYTSSAPSGSETTDLVYRITGNVLITNQPATYSNAEYINFSFDVGEILVLDYGGSKTWFKRA